MKDKYKTVRSVIDNLLDEHTKNLIKDYHVEIVPFVGDYFSVNLYVLIDSEYYNSYNSITKYSQIIQMDKNLKAIMKYVSPLKYERYLFMDDNPEQLQRYYKITGQTE